MKEANLELRQTLRSHNKTFYNHHTSVYYIAQNMYTGLFCFGLLWFIVNSWKFKWFIPIFFRLPYWKVYDCHNVSKINAWVPFY